MSNTWKPGERIVCVDDFLEWNGVWPLEAGTIYVVVSHKLCACGCNGKRVDIGIRSPHTNGSSCVTNRLHWTHDGVWWFNAERFRSLDDEEAQASLAARKAIDTPVEHEAIPS